MRHDFGILSPGEKVRHRFRLVNDGEGRWTYRQFQTSCSCTAGSVSTPYIERGEAGEVEVSYTAPAGIGDERKAVGVLFAERDAPVFDLVVEARVRTPITVTLPVISFPNVGANREATKEFEVHNYSKRDVSLNFVNQPSWISFSLTPVNARATAGGPRQVWRAAAVVRTDGLSSGQHRAEVLVRAEGDDLPPIPVAVAVTVTSPVRVIPDRAFFGKVPSSRPSVHRLLVRSTPETAEELDHATLDHDLGDRLKLEWAGRSPTDRVLSVTLTPGPDEPFVTGSITIGFRDRTLPPLTVPVQAMAEREGGEG